MSTTENARPAFDRPTASDRPTATFPTGQRLTGQAAIGHGEARLDEQAELAHRERLAASSPFADWRGQAQTELLPAVSSDAGRPASGGRLSRRPRVSTLPEPTGSRVARHLRAALAAIALAAAVLIPMQLFAAQGISAARQAALAERAAGTEGAVPDAAPSSTMSGQTSAPATMSDRTSASQPDVRSDIPADWVTETTHVAYDRTSPAASPLDLPRCTTSPDTPLPCLATISPSQTRAVVLEEDASLTALVRR